MQKRLGILYWKFVWQVYYACNLEGNGVWSNCMSPRGMELWDALDVWWGGLPGEYTKPRLKERVLGEQGKWITRVYGYLREKVSRQEECGEECQNRKVGDASAVATGIEEQGLRYKGRDRLHQVDRVFVCAFHLDFFPCFHISLFNPCSLFSGTVIFRALKLLGLQESNVFTIF